MIHCGGSVTVYLAPLKQRPYLMSMLFLSLCCSVVAYFLSSYALTKMSVARETVFANLTTAVSDVAGAVFLKEPFTWQGATCCAVILLGIYGVQRASPGRT